MMSSEQILGAVVLVTHSLLLCKTVVTGKSQGGAALH